MSIYDVLKLAGLICLCLSGVIGVALVFINSNKPVQNKRVIRGAISRNARWPEPIEYRR